MTKNKNRINFLEIGMICLLALTIGFPLRTTAATASDYWKTYFSQIEKEAVEKNAEKYVRSEIKKKSQKWKNLFTSFNIKNGSIKSDDIKSLDAGKIKNLDDAVSDKVSTSGGMLSGALTWAAEQTFVADNLTGAFAALNGSRITNLNPANMSTGSMNLGSGSLTSGSVTTEDITASGNVAMGTTKRVNTLAAWIAADADVGVSQIILNGAVTMTAPISTTKPLYIEKGGLITTDGNLLTFGSAFDAGDYQAFQAAAGEVRGLKQIRPEWWHDGENDYYPALSCALEAWKDSTAGNLLINGNYTIDTGLSVDFTTTSVSKKGISGSGSITSNLSTGYVLTITADALVRNLTLEGFKIVGGASETGGIKLDGGTAAGEYLYGNSLRDLYIEGIIGHGIHITNNTFETNITSCNLRTSDTTGYGIYVEGGLASSIDITNSNTSGFDIGVFVKTPTSDVKISGGTFILAQKEGIKYDNMMGQSIVNVHVENNWESAADLDSGGGGIRVAGLGSVINAVGTTNSKQKYVVSAFSNAGHVINVIGGLATGSTIAHTYFDGSGNLNLIGSMTYETIYGAGTVTRMGQGYKKVINVATSNTGEDDLGTRVIKAKSMGTHGALRVLASGTKSGEAGDKTIKLHFGDCSWTVHPASNTITDWRVEATIANRWVNSSQVITWICYDGTTIVGQGQKTCSVNTTSDVTLKLTGECAVDTDTITEGLLIVDPF